MCDYSSAIDGLNEQFAFKGDRIQQEREVIEKAITILNKKISWYKPWEIFSHIKELKRATILLTSISTSCLTEVMNLQQNHLLLIEAQECFQQQLEIMGREED